MSKKTGFFAFFLMALLILILGRATWYEHIHGSADAYTQFYNSIWFTLLWILLGTFSLYYMVIASLHKRFAVFLLHISFLIILSGALITRMTGKTGQVHLRENHPVSFFFDDGTRQKILLPFSLSLKSFEIEYYPGTTTPANYISIVDVKDKQNGKTFEQEISMNRIFRYQGFRFYQSSFDDDWKGSILSVNHDTWGIFFSYAGYFLMFFSMLLVLFSKRERFRFLLKKLSQKAVLVFLLACPLWANASPSLLTGDSLTVSKEQAKRLGEIWVDYNGRIAPVQTLANDFTKKLTGKNHYKYASGEQVLFGWLFFPEKWQYVPMFEVESDELKRMTGAVSGKACLADFIDAGGHYKLEPYRRQMYASNKPKGWLKEAVKIDDKIHLIEMLQQGNLLKIFPLNSDNGLLQWYAPNMVTPIQADSMENLFARHFFPLYFESITQGNSENAFMYLDKLLSFQQKKAGDILPSANHLKIEQLYNRIPVFSLLFKICLGLGSISLFFFIWGTVRNRSFPKVETALYGLLCMAFLIATIGLGLRAYIGGRIPMSNGYETMLILAWFGLLIGVLTRKYAFLITVFSFLLSGFTLLVAHISSMNPQITPLVPVLQSPLLSIHVLTIMVAYGLCGFMALNSITSLIIWASGKKKPEKQAYIERMKETSELFMYPATFLMGAGIFIGAIWANVSWGRYWGWDPKEVWALITFLLMSFTFHSKTLSWFRKPLFYHIFVLVIFLAVLMTYFGVNYILGGKHSYAG
jgi:ABC-type transport system involved in cytochrome c biogenesis permease subunit